MYTIHISKISLLLIWLNIAKFLTDDTLTTQRMDIQEWSKTERVQSIYKFSLMAAGDTIINAENLLIKSVEKHKPII